MRGNLNINWEHWDGSEHINSNDIKESFESQDENVLEEMLNAHSIKDNDTTSTETETNF